MKTSQLLACGLGALDWKVRRTSRPLNIMISLTNRCTSHCSYCDIPLREQDEPSTEELFSLIDQARELGAQRLGFWGGEPLLRDDIVELVSYAHLAGLYVTLDTNGMLLERRLRVLDRLDHLLVALDGPEAVHDLVRGKGSQRRALAAIRLARRKLPVWTITVLHRHNLSNLPWILDTAAIEGFLTTFQVLHHNALLSRSSSRLFPEDRAYRDAFDYLLRKKRAGAAVASSKAYLRHVRAWGDYRRPTRRTQVGGLACLAGELFCNVDTDGRVYPCSLLIGQVPAADYRRVGLDQALRSTSRQGCQACLAACFTEYNLLFSLHLGTILEWLEAFTSTRRR